METNDFFKQHRSIISDLEHRQIEQFFHSPYAHWCYTGFSNHGDNSRFWYCDLSGDLFFAAICVERLRAELPHLGDLKTVYANGQTPGQNGNWHTDGSTGTTILWYLNTLPPGGGGRTLFKEEETIVSNQSMKNTMISFPANILHMGEAPTQEHRVLRVTVAWKFN